MKALASVLIVLLLLSIASADYRPGATTGAGSGTVTSVTSANARATVATTTTTPVITIVSAPSADSVTGQAALLAAKATVASVAALKDTTTKGYAYTSLAAGDSNIVFEVRRSGCTIREIRAIRTGGTSASINVTKNNASDLLTGNYATTTSMASAGTLQNNTLAIGDIIRVTVRAISGTATEIFIQFTIEEPQL